jgi:hypothetical protein
MTDSEYFEWANYLCAKYGIAAPFDWRGDADED